MLIKEKFTDTVNHTLDEFEELKLLVEYLEKIKNAKRKN